LRHDEAKRQLQATNAMQKAVLDAMQFDRLEKHIHQLVGHLERRELPIYHPDSPSWTARDPIDLRHIERDINSNIARESQREVLSVLRFEQMDWRLNQVADAHESTFGWAVRPGERPEADWDDFALWLSTNDPQHAIYWVTGQPGSGKSTLMKHLANCGKNRTILHSWAGLRDVHTAQCYFWAPGTQMQKSMERHVKNFIA
jgi:hypothetical protein